MEEVTYWRADDGKTFEDEDECREYEFGIYAKELEGRVFLLDRQGSILPLDEYGNYAEAYFIYLADDDAWSDLQDRWPSFDSYFPRELWSAEAGLWEFDDSDDSWNHVGQQMRRLQETAEMCMKSINGGK